MANDNMTTMGLRVTKECRDFISNFLESKEVTQSKFISDFVDALKSGGVSYTGDGFKTNERVVEKIVEVEKEVEVPAPVKSGDSAKAEATAPAVMEGIDVSELVKIAGKKRVTPQSLLQSALKPFYP
mgnify:CR=1 FL=1